LATRDVGYQFVKWSGDVDTIGNVNAHLTTITMQGSYSITANFEEEKAAHFADPNLDAAIRETIDIHERPVCPSDLKALTSLAADHRNIADLAGLEQCTSLTELRLRFNQISDISPLANLISLTWLDLNDNQINDIEPLVNNPALSQGDTVYSGNNPLSLTSINTYIPQLEARGVTVDC